MKKLCVITDTPVRLFLERYNIMLKTFETNIFIAPLVIQREEEDCKIPYLVQEWIKMHMKRERIFEDHDYKIFLESGENEFKTYFLFYSYLEPIDVFSKFVFPVYDEDKNFIRWRNYNEH